MVRGTNPPRSKRTPQQRQVSQQRGHSARGVQPAPRRRSTGNNRVQASSRSMASSRPHNDRVQARKRQVGTPPRGGSRPQKRNHSQSYNHSLTQSRFRFDQISKFIKITDLYSGTSRIDTWRRLLLVFLAVWAIVTVIGVFKLWPSGEPNIAPEFYKTFSLGQNQVDGEIVAESKGSCTAPESGTVFTTSPRITPGSDSSCTWYIAEITEGDDAGKRTLIVNSGQPGEATLATGDHIRLLQEQSNDASVHYSFSDYQRTVPLALWGILIAGAIILFAALRGLRSLIGLIITMVVVITFTLPALLLGTSPTGIAIFSGAVILFLVVFLVHGFNWKSASALGGTLLALLLAALLANVAIDNTHLRGLGDEGNLQILLYLPDVSVTGLMLCGFIIGALGVLNDVTIAQSSTVNELAELDHNASWWRLFLGAMKVGRDHISSMVYTLVLSYTGASLPLLLLLFAAQRPFLQTLTSDIMATELLRSGIGALTLTLAVPLTTVIAALTVPEQRAAVQ
ncbi:YibE/F family protein [Corynebacterium pseudotuberculosis]|uniref:YibE/F family protein n=1 Tax=Corynebacterium pseudotuberculosis 258 TaxID=1168865 RepID=A0AAU8PZG0_CORPS|nr:YibE/F family protein [Corynebacterium pseudotuberculosis]AER69918.1 YibE/F family protein [Corynebacterium pseudotuberculosis 1/06-A]AEQ07452.1 YibE/F family protein [Corynebacterium pseudotuberculosis CIP 52.97]AFB73262.1 YibE/F family protein [Corynebacterium pseudotuberculosis 316]AFH91712.2 YibE/F family protein [Corynebacterium pseudotuberculosis 31]AFK17559.3 YibE/F family protein [Corynebacterium pseudotuberculosis 258]